MGYVRPRSRDLVLWLAVAVCAPGCSGSRGAAVDASPAWDAIHPLFAPSPLPLDEAIGIAGPTPLGPDPATTAARRVELGLLRSAGIRSERTDFRWALIEPAQGQLDFSAIDTGLADLAGAGVTPLPILDATPAWASATGGGDWGWQPDHPADFAAFAKAVAAHCKGTVPSYEIWNEENVGLVFWRPMENPPVYARFLEAAATAIRGSDPAARVIFGGIHYQDEGGALGPTFLDQVYDADPAVAGAFDAVALHPYPRYPPAVPPEYGSSIEVPEPLMVAQIRAVMAHHGDGGKPIYANEIGWPTLNGVTEDMQARWLVRSALLLLASGAQTVDWYQLEDSNLPKLPAAESHFGLLRYVPPGQTPPAKPGWQALRTLLALCGTLRITGDLRSALPLPQDGYAYRLEGPTWRVTVLWRADETAAPVTISVPVTGQPVTLYTLDGRSQPEPPGGSVSVSIGPAPIYVVESL